MSSNTNGEFVVHETAKTIEYVRDNWKDPLGQQYITWLEQTLETLKTMERKREVLRLKETKIRLLCRKAEEADGEPQKVLRR